MRKKIQAGQSGTLCLAHEGAHNHLTHPPTHHPQTLSVVQAASMRCFTRSRSRSVDTAAAALDSASSSCLRATAASARSACTLSCNMRDGVHGWMVGVQCGVKTRRPPAGLRAAAASARKACTLFCST